MESLPAPEAPDAQAVVTEVDITATSTAEKFAGATEETVGISAFLNPSVAGFSGIVKQRYSDFIVREIDKSGQVVRLRSFDLPKVAEVALKSSDGVQEDSQDKGLQLLAPYMSGEKLQQFRAFCSDVDCEDFFFLDAEPDKARRTAVHEIIRRHLPFLESDTRDGPEKAVRVYRKHSRSRRKRSRNGSTEQQGSSSSARRGWPSGLGRYLRFVLYKENRDTLDAILTLSRFLRCQPKVFAYAGTKDKRAVTTQRVTAFHIAPERLLAINPTLHGIKTGDFEFCDEQLKLGDLLGNEFTIVLRDVKGSDEEVEAAVASLRDLGFINYYGLQRFGTSAVATHTIGLALLRGDWREAIDLILRPRPGESAEATSARKYYAETNDIDGTLQRLPRFMTVERLLLNGLASHDASDPLSAISMLPRNSRLLYVHAYQSAIWNRLASLRIQRFGPKPVPGDLVLPSATDPVSLAGDLPELPEEDLVQPQPLRQDPDDSCDLPPLPDCIQHPHASPSLHPRVVTTEDVESGRVAIEDVVLPLPGYDVVYPENGLRDAYRDAVAADGLDLDHLRRGQKEYSLSGSYRRLVVRPRNLTWRMQRYKDVNMQLEPTDQDVLSKSSMPTPVPDGALKALVLRFSLPSSSYATICIRELLKTSSSVAFHKSLNPPSLALPRS